MKYILEPMSGIHRYAVIDIYNYFGERSFAAYPDTKVPYEIFDRFMDVSKGCPAAIIKTVEGQVVGFGFLHHYLPWRTFNRTLEVTYFILPDHTGKGLGRRMLEYFLCEANVMGVRTVLASISSRNPQSISFHRKAGFEECGRFRDVGRKFGKWFDVVWM
jgi:phosphinothricin acetyltransferase